MWVLMGLIIGFGWFFGFKDVLMEVGLVVIIFWIIGGVVIVIFVLLYVEFGGMYFVFGGIACFLYYVFGGVVGVLFGWFVWFNVVMVVLIEVLVMFIYVGYYEFVKGWIDEEILVLSVIGILVVIVLMVIMVVINFLGVKKFVVINSVMIWWKIVVLLLIILVFVIINFDISNLYVVDGFMFGGLKFVFVVILISGIIFSYFGFE